jgi:hypothetical protein
MKNILEILDPPNQPILSMNYQTQPTVSKITTELTSALGNFLALKKLVIKIEGEHSPLGLEKAILERLRITASKMLPTQLGLKNQFYDPALVALSKADNLEYSEAVGIIQVVAQNSAKFTSDNTLLVHHTRRVSWALSVLSSETSHFAIPQLTYPQVKSNLKDHFVLPASHFSKDKQLIYIEVGDEQYGLAKKYIPSSIITDKTLEQVKLDRYEEQGAIFIGKDDVPWS